MHERKPANVLTTEWEASPEDRSAIASLIGIDPFEEDVIRITKGYDNRLIWSCVLDDHRVVEHLVSTAQLDPEESSQLRGATSVTDLLRILNGIASPSSAQSELLSHLNQVFPNGSLSNTVVQRLTERLPAFVYFSTYERMPGSVALDDLIQRQESSTLELSDRIFLALLELVGTSPSEIQRIGPPSNSGYVFRTRIENLRHGVTVNFDERSSGFVWFFSDLVLASAEKLR